MSCGKVDCKRGPYSEKMQGIRRGRGQTPPIAFDARRMGLPLLVLVLGLAASASRAGEVESPTCTASVVANDDLLSLRAGVRPWGEKTEIGLYGIFRDGIQQDGEDALGGGVYATYDVAEGEFGVLFSFKVPIVWYVGGMAGFLCPARIDRNDLNAAAGLMTGLSFGGRRVRIGVEYQYALSDLWKEFAEVDPEGEIVLCLAYRF